MPNECRDPGDAPVWRGTARDTGTAFLHTTKGLLLTEQRAINRALERHDDRLAITQPSGLHRAMRRRTLSPVQETMVQRLTTSGAGVEVVVGKTYALDAARRGLANVRHPRHRGRAGRPRRTRTRAVGRHPLDHTRSADRTARRPPRRVAAAAGSVLVVDEAGMVGSRQLARLLDHAQVQQVKVVLVGDPRQLPEIDAGGLFRAMTTRLAAIELTENRRQTHTWEQAALDELRHGDPDQAMTTYTSHGRIRTADTAEAVRQQLVDHWWATARDDLPDR